jgi:hypothetical protein
VPESLTDAEKAQLYAVGEPVQQQFLLENLAGLVKGSGPSAFAAISSQLPRLAEVAGEEGQVIMPCCSDWGGLHFCKAGLGSRIASRPTALQQIITFLMQEALAEALAAILRGRLLLHAQVVGTILPLVLPRSIVAGSSATVLEAWLGCFKELVAALDWQTLHSRVLPAAVLLAGAGGAHSVSSRCLCCRLVLR